MYPAVHKGYHKTGFLSQNTCIKYILLLTRKTFLRFDVLKIKRSTF